MADEQKYVVQLEHDIAMNDFETLPLIYHIKDKALTKRVDELEERLEYYRGLAGHTITNNDQTSTFYCDGSVDSTWINNSGTESGVYIVTSFANDSKDIMNNSVSSELLYNLWPTVTPSSADPIESSNAPTDDSQGTALLTTLKNYFIQDDILGNFLVYANNYTAQANISFPNILIVGEISNNNGATRPAMIIDGNGIIWCRKKSTTENEKWYWSNIFDDKINIRDYINLLEAFYNHIQLSDYLMKKIKELESTVEDLNNKLGSINTLEDTTVTTVSEDLLEVSGQYLLVIGDDTEFGTNYNPAQALADLLKTKVPVIWLQSKSSTKDLLPLFTVKESENSTSYFINFKENSFYSAQFDPEKINLATGIADLWQCAAIVFMINSKDILSGNQKGSVQIGNNRIYTTIGDGYDSKVTTAGLTIGINAQKSYVITHIKNGGCNTHQLGDVFSEAPSDGCNSTSYYIPTQVSIPVNTLSAHVQSLIKLLKEQAPNAAIKLITPFKWNTTNNTKLNDIQDTNTKLFLGAVADIARGCGVQFEQFNVYNSTLTASIDNENNNFKKYLTDIRNSVDTVLQTLTIEDKTTPNQEE